MRLVSLDRIIPSTVVRRVFLEFKLVACVNENSSPTKRHLRCQQSVGVHAIQGEMHSNENERVGSDNILRECNISRATGKYQVGLTAIVHATPKALVAAPVATVAEINFEMMLLVLVHIEREA